MKFEANADLERVFATLSKAKLCYVVLPYRDYPRGIDKAWTAAVQACAALQAAGIPVFSSVVHWHPVAKASRVGADAKPSRRAAFRIFDVCDAVLVLTMVGWKESPSVLDILKRADQHMKPVFYLPVPDDLADATTRPEIAQKA